MSEQSDLTNYSESTATDSTETTASGSDTETAGIEFWPPLPEDWDLVSPEEAFAVNPSYDTVSDENPYIEMDAVDTVLPYPAYIGTRNAEDYSGKRFRAGDTLFARITPCTENGKVGFVPDLDGKVGVGSTEYAVLSPDRETIHPWFLYYVVRSHRIRDYAISRMRGSTGRQRVPFDVFRREIDIPLPPMEEQRKIAGVFNNIDQNIKAVEDVVEQLHRVKKGTVQRLLAQGTAEDPDTTSTSVGEIPEHWEVTSIGDIVEMAQYGISESLSQTGEYPIFRMNNMENGYMVGEPMKYIDLDDEEFEKYRVEKGDILFNRTNSHELVGKTGIFELDGDYVFASYLVRLRTNDRADPYYLNYYMNSEQGQNRLQAFATKGVSQSNINATSVQRVKLPLPPRDKQQEIADIIKSIDTEIEENEAYREQLIEVKTALMQDLLTGEVRTAGKEIDVPAEVARYDPE